MLQATQMPKRPSFGFGGIVKSILVSFFFATLALAQETTIHTMAPLVTVLVSVMDAKDNRVQGILPATSFCSITASPGP